MKTVKEMSKQSGISVRTLHYYDQIGLLPPAEITAAGYRLYGEAELSRLQQILFLRELEFSLASIAEILQSPCYSSDASMRKHRDILIKKRDRLDGLVSLLDDLLKGEQKMSFKEFDTTEIEHAKAMYKEEVQQRWGSTNAYHESEAKTSAYNQQDWQNATSEMELLFHEFAKHMDKEPAHHDVQNTVGRWQQHITDRYYNCTDEILAGLGELYAADERFRKNIDKHSAGLADFISAAIREYCRSK